MAKTFLQVYSSKLFKLAIFGSKTLYFLILSDNNTEYGRLYLRYSMEGETA